jgi:mRNA interferase RelE/StbE
LSDSAANAPQEYKLQIGKQAEKYISKLDKPTRKRFANQLESLKADPMGNSKAIVNSDPPARSCRVGDWRIVFSLNEENRVVIVSMVLPRGQVYDRI